MPITNRSSSCILLNFYIKPQHQTRYTSTRAVVSYWISTSNHNYSRRWPYVVHVVSYWISTSNHNSARRQWKYQKVVSYWISTSNHNEFSCFSIWYNVVSYWISTSNHNRSALVVTTALVVSYWISTSNHNLTQERFFPAVCCILLNFYIKPQPLHVASYFIFSCILLNFYIKPQLFRQIIQSDLVVSYWISTSNHNLGLAGSALIGLYLIEFLHQTTTVCIPCVYVFQLYLIEFLHQTTTLGAGGSRYSGCILLNFYIKPQQRVRHVVGHSCCILLNFYIKPQLSATKVLTISVVSYWISTSNHNKEFGM